MDARFRELAERLGALEQTSSLEARFVELAHELKNGSETLQSELLLARLDRLERQLDGRKRFPANRDRKVRQDRPGKLPLDHMCLPQRAGMRDHVALIMHVLGNVFSDASSVADDRRRRSIMMRPPNCAGRFWDQCFSWPACGVSGHRRGSLRDLCRRSHLSAAGLSA